MNPIFFGTVKDEKLVFQNQVADKFNEFLKGLEGNDVQVVVSKPKKHISNNQRRYYFGVVVKMLSDFLGYTTEEMHDALRILFLKREDTVMVVVRSITSLTTVEMELYLSKIRMWASQDLDLYLPLPREIDY